MHISFSALLLTILCMPSAGYGAQAASAGAPSPSSSSTGQETPAAPSHDAAVKDAAPGNVVPGNIVLGKVVPDAVPGPFASLLPALDSLRQTLGALQLEKWKKGPVREEAAANIQSMQRDLQSTLPALLAAADAAPQTMSKVLPVSRNIDALYDVLLRAVDGARIVAPGEQFTPLQRAMTDLEKARQALADRMEETASVQERQIGDLQLALKAQTAPVCPVVAAKKKAVKKKPAAKPAPVANSQPVPAPKPPQ